VVCVVRWYEVHKLWVVDRGLSCVCLCMSVSRSIYSRCCSFYVTMLYCVPLLYTTGFNTIYSVSPITRCISHPGV
jgi:hypothetical protein